MFAATSFIGLWITDARIRKVDSSPELQNVGFRPMETGGWDEVVRGAAESQFLLTIRKPSGILNNDAWTGFSFSIRDILTLQTCACSRPGVGHEGGCIFHKYTI